MSIFALAGLCVCAAIVCKTLEKDSREFSSVILIAISCFIVFCAVSQLSKITEIIQSLFSSAGISSTYLEILFKALGICYITQLACDCCRDCGESALSTQLELCGRLSIVVISIPLYSSVIEIIETLIGK